ncbi:exocyst complex component exo70 [Actinomortierella ambigua]|uniref:Exocyst complex protein EXO70 n=1 Tax=Actinomortierella ambigua TaxID=1343610 RepID=A0A9P6U219_9FUNG|nr:exocyst complex component exo70 [Actinomortierella ambigua]
MAVASDSLRENKFSTFLDEEAAELGSLENSLKKTNEVSTHMVDILNSFDSRLGHLETSVKPIQEATQSLTRTAGNMNQTVAALETILKYFDLAAQEEAIVMRPIKDQDLATYIGSITRIRDALKTMGSINLRASDKVVQQLKKSLAHAAMQLAELFKKLVTQQSQPLDLKVVTSTDRKDIPVVPSAVLQALVTLAKNLAELEIDTNAPNTGYLKAYCEIRSNCMKKSLTPLYQSCSMELRGVYEKGTTPFIPYTTSLLKLCRNEADLAANMMDPKLLSLAFMGSIVPPIEQWVESGRSLITRIRKSYITEVGILFDAIDVLEGNMETFNSVFGLARRQKDNDAKELLKSFKAGAMRSFIDFINDLKSNNSAKYQAMPLDGTVHQLTSDTMNYLKRLLTYQTSVDALLTLIGDGMWNNPDAGGTPRRSTASRSNSGRHTAMKHYFEDAVDALVAAIEVKSKFYKKKDLMQLFLLNNYYYISKSVKSQPKLAELLGVDANAGPGVSSASAGTTASMYERLFRQTIDAYQENWKGLIENLMDVTYVQDGDVQHILNSQQRQTIKDKFKAFNHDFEEMWKTQKTYSIPDVELRQLVLKDMHQVVLPMYDRFMNKYSSSSNEFTKNLQKYIRYDVSMIRDLINQFFTAT